MVTKIRKARGNMFCPECKRIILPSEEIISFLDQWGEEKNHHCIDCAEKKDLL